MFLSFHLRYTNQSSQFVNSRYSTTNHSLPFWHMQQTSQRRGVHIPHWHCYCPRLGLFSARGWELLHQRQNRMKCCLSKPVGLTTICRMAARSKRRNVTTPVPSFFSGSHFCWTADMWQVPQSVVNNKYGHSVSLPAQEISMCRKAAICSEISPM